jgi:hypothetical protein
MRRMKVYFDDRTNGGRKLVDVELIEDRPTTMKVKLPDGNVVTRKKTRDLPKEKETL